MAKGLVVPSDPSPDNWQIVPLRIPDDPEWNGIVRGLLLEACFGYWWKKNTGDWQAARDTACEIAAGFDMTNFCDEVTKCIQTNEGTRGAIDETIDERLKSDPEHVIGTGQAIIAACNENAIFGSVTQIVDSVNTFIIDALEIIEVTTNVIETVSRWVGAVPIFGGTLDALLDTIDAIISDDIKENYEANFTAGLRDTYRCDIFCIFIENDCEVTPSMLLEYFAGRLGTITFDTVLEILDYLVTGTYSGAGYVDVMYFLAIGMIAVNEGLGFFDLSSTYTLDTMVALGGRSPSSDWEILCDPCDSEWQATFDFVAGDGGWNTRIAGESILQVGDGWIASGTGGFNFYEAGTAKSLVLGTATLEEFDVEYYSLNPKDTPVPFTWRVQVDGVNYPIPSTTGIQTFSETGLSVTGTVLMYAFMHFTDTGSTSACAIRKITLRGTGPNPF